MAPTKVLAKTANHYAKKIPENQGVFILDSPEKVQEALKIFEIDEVWGIGRQYAKLLQSLNIKTAWDFTQLDDAWVRKKMTVVGLRVKKGLEGISCLQIELVPSAKKMICTSRSFGTIEGNFLNCRNKVYEIFYLKLIRTEKRRYNMIIDWTNTIKTLQSDPSQEDMFFETITNDLRSILDGAFHGDLVIIRFSEGFRAEVRFLYEIGFPDLKSVVKDFNTIRQYDLQVEQIGKLRDQAAELLKSNPEKADEFDKYIKQKVEQPLFELNYVLDNKVVKSFSRVDYLTVHMSIMGMLKCFYQDKETIE